MKGKNPYWVDVKTQKFQQIGVAKKLSKLES